MFLSKKNASESTIVIITFQEKIGKFRQKLFRLFFGKVISQQLLALEVQSMLQMKSNIPFD